MMHPFICDMDSPVSWMVESDGLTGRVYQASELCRDSVLSPSSLHALHSRVFTWREFLSFCSTDPQWLKQVSLISHKPLINKLIWIDTGSSICYITCLWNWDLDRQPKLPLVLVEWQGWQQPWGRESWEKKKLTHQGVELLILTHCLLGGVRLQARAWTGDQSPTSSPLQPTPLWFCRQPSKPLFHSSTHPVPKLDCTDGLDLCYQELPVPLPIPGGRLQPATFNLVVLFSNSSEAARS